MKFNCGTLLNITRVLEEVDSFVHVTDYFQVDLLFNLIHLVQIFALFVRALLCYLAFRTFL